jgi:hypothetical protein
MRTGRTITYLVHLGQDVESLYEIDQLSVQRGRVLQHQGKSLIQKKAVKFIEVQQRENSKFILLTGVLSDPRATFQDQKPRNKQTSFAFLQLQARGQ